MVVVVVVVGGTTRVVVVVDRLCWTTAWVGAAVAAEAGAVMGGAVVGGAVVGLVAPGVDPAVVSLASSHGGTPPPDGRDRS